jgi:hypothetical protein
MAGQRMECGELASEATHLAIQSLPFCRGKVVVVLAVIALRWTLTWQSTCRITWGGVVSERFGLK